MNKIEEALWKDYYAAEKLIESWEVGSENYKEAVKERDNIRNELLKLEQINKEANIKAMQIKSDKWQEKMRISSSLLTFGANLIVIIWGTRKTFKFDEVATVTSTMGRGILSGVSPKLFRR